MVLFYLLVLHSVKTKSPYLAQAGLQLIAIFLPLHFSAERIDIYTMPGTIFLWRTRSLVMKAEGFTKTGTRAQCTPPPRSPKNNRGLPLLSQGGVYKAQMPLHKHTSNSAFQSTASLSQIQIRASSGCSPHQDHLMRSSDTLISLFVIL